MPIDIKNSKVSEFIGRILRKYEEDMVFNSKIERPRAQNKKYRQQNFLGIASILFKYFQPNQPKKIFKMIIT